jgi:hypothetical protein
VRGGRRARSRLKAVQAQGRRQLAELADERNEAEAAHIAEAKLLAAVQLNTHMRPAVGILHRVIRHDIQPAVVFECTTSRSPPLSSAHQDILGAAADGEALAGQARAEGGGSDGRRLPGCVQVR